MTIADLVRKYQVAAVAFVVAVFNGVVLEADALGLSPQVVLVLHIVSVAVGVAEATRRVTPVDPEERGFS